VTRRGVSGAWPLELYHFLVKHHYAIFSARVAPHHYQPLLTEQRGCHVPMHTSLSPHRLGGSALWPRADACFSRIRPMRATSAL
jgi:hypothetical protein